MTAGEWVQILCAATFPLLVVAVAADRIFTQKGTGYRIIQYVGAVTFMPGLVLLTMAGLVDGPAAAALIGVFIGYLFFSSFGKNN